MENIELNEGLIDSIHDFLRSNGIMKTKWRGREIGSGGVISNAYKSKVLSKDRIKKIIGSLKGDASVFLLHLYDETKDEDFLPKTAQEIFLF